MLKKLWRRISNRDRLAYLMVVVFGLAFLMETLYFQLGSTKALLSNGQILDLGGGYIYEPRLWVRILEGVLALGLVALGVERLVNYRRARR